MSPAEPGRRARPGEVVESPVGDELVHTSRAAPQEGPDHRRHLYLVRQQARRRANRRHLLVSIVIGSAATLGMGLVALHVLIAENQFKLDNLQQQASTEQASYERLRLNVAQLESPSRIVSMAEGTLGMQQPGSITYLPATTTPVPRGGASGGSPSSGGSVSGGSVSSPQGDADWPSIKPFLSGNP